jgi:tRNA(Ile)-lysidine synthase
VVVEEALASPGAEGGEEAHIDFDLAAWRALPVALQRSTLREAIHRLRRSLRNVNFVHVEHAVQVVRDGTTGDQATLPQGLMLTVGYDRFTIAGTEFEEPAPDWPLLSADSREIPVMVPGDTPLPDTEWVLKAVAVDWAKLPVGWNENEDPWTAYLDAKSAGGGLVLRRRRPGDRFRPQGMGGHRVKLADFYTNQKVARAARDRLPLLVAGASEPAAARILWACGLRVDEQARVVETTERVLVVRFVRI